MYSICADEKYSVGLRQRDPQSGRYLPLGVYWVFLRVDNYLEAEKESNIIPDFLKWYAVSFALISNSYMVQASTANVISIATQ